MVESKKPTAEFFNYIKNSFPNFIVTEKEFTHNFIGMEKKGNFGQVTRGTHKGKQVAIKKMKLLKDSIKMVLKDESEFVLIDRELTILSMISSDNIPTLEGIYIDSQKDEINFILEYIDGKTLYDHLSENPNWNYYQRLLLATKLCKILVDIRQNEVIHRDIKPENILIENNIYKETLEPYLIDFGFSKIQMSDKHYSITKSKCTPLYSPPENLMDEQDYMQFINSSEKSLLTPLSNKGVLTKISYKVDVWSFGCVLYEIFTKKKPWTHIIESKFSNRKKLLDVSDIALFFDGVNKIYTSTDKVNFPEIIDIVDNCTIISVKERWEIEKVYSKMLELLNKQRVKIKQEEDGILYEGEIIKITGFDNKTETFYDGFGRYKIDDEDDEEKVIYIGNYEYSRKSGLGIHKTNDSLYLGYWRNDEKNGFGYNCNTEYNVNYYYIGKYKKNKKEGFGKYVIEGESVSIGIFSNDVLLEGIRYDIQKNLIYKGHFEFDILIIGELYDINKNEVYCGQFSDNKRNGYGYTKDIINNKTKQCGLWNNNKLVKVCDLMFD